MTQSHDHGNTPLKRRSQKADFTRRDFLLSGAAMIGGTLFSRFINRAESGLGKWIKQLSGKRIYIAPDDHTDYFWSAGEDVYRQAFVDMIDYYLDLADTTQGNPAEHQSRWNCDGSFWLWTYEKNKSKAEYDRLISRIKDGHISVPLTALVLCLGGVPAEAVLRGMYYPGKIERRENLRFRLAVSMENQTLPLGLVSLWAGSGARFSWKGICSCDTHVSAAGDREHEIYWWDGLDGSRILMKWNSMLQGNQSMGGYAEARNPDAVVDFVDSDATFIEKYPYSIIGCFGKGWDDVQTMTDEFVTVAQSKTNDVRQVIVSNEEDFFDDFEANYGAEIPSQTVSFGNEWDLYCAALAETSANVKRSLETLRSAEAIATLVMLNDPSFMDGREDARDQAWMDLGLFWEHNFGMASMPEERTQERVAWQKRLDKEISAYVTSLADDANSALGNFIPKSGDAPCFYVFNPLSWERTDFADIPLNSSNPVYAIDKTNGEEVPSQIVDVDGKKYLRILASQIPSLGYKVFEIRDGEGQKSARTVTVNGNVIENQYYQVTVAENGAITSWKDKARNNRELVKQIDGVTVNDLGAGSGSIRVENEGPVSVTLVVESSAPLNHTTRITLFGGVPRVEIRNTIGQNFEETQIWAFGFDLPNPNVWHEEVGALINAKLATDGGHYSPRINNSRYDWLTLNHFMDMSSGDLGVTLSNADCYFMRLGKSTISELDTLTPQISVLAGGKVVGTGNGISSQGGVDSFLQRFALTSHGAYDPVSAMKFALEHQNPFVTGEVLGTAGYRSDQYSFLTMDNPNVLVWALKPADDGPDAGIVVRVWNVSQSQQSFSLRFSSNIKKASQVTHIETPVGDATVQDGALVGALTTQQMKTYAVWLDASAVPTAIPVPSSSPATPSGSATVAPTSPAGVTPTSTPTPSGNGCLFGLLAMFFDAFR
ncbi:MAG: hypothetical protein QM730_16505 [Anaerolineales bacterium]